MNPTGKKMKYQEQARKLHLELIEAEITHSIQIFDVNRGGMLKYEYSPQGAEMVGQMEPTPEGIRANSTNEIVR